MDEFGTGEVDAVNGAFMLVRAEAVAEVGLMDEGYWLYGEDLDWCYRFKQAGWTVWYDGTVSTTHVKGAVSKNSGHRPLRLNVAYHQSMGRFYRKFHGGRSAAKDPAVYLALGIMFVVSVVRSAIARRSFT